ncbi:MAG: hypothetical protein BYD32DRAFT_429026 [Podila humilis]|nr:MAG: hypothetical protein BYD32DRAFT_429026 [Podila humilis]
MVMTKCEARTYIGDTSMSIKNQTNFGRRFQKNNNKGLVVYAQEQALCNTIPDI